ncbi:MAG: tRNA (adenosine(37)-N6)-dimethylallyltransferase, partial [Terriglobales bacterium]
AERGSAHLHRMLKRVDAAAAVNIHPNDAPKLIRALEVCLESKARLSELWKSGRDPLAGFRVLRLGLDPERNALYTRINQRAKKMFDDGLVEETRRLRAKYGESARPLGSLGYKQAMQYLSGEIDLKLALWATQQAHRNYAKRQLTWFRREPEVRWLRGFGDEPGIQQQAVAAVEILLTADSRG